MQSWIIIILKHFEANANAPLQDMCVPLCAIIILIRPSIIIYYSNTAEDKNKIVFRRWLKIVTSM